MSVINTNITSLIGQHNLSKSQSALQTSMERLSSGLRINSAKDDAAGQAIANRMTAQITGLAQAQRNANDGISVAQTAEGALNQVNDNLQRIRELAVQAANGTNSSNDLQSIQDEIGQRLEEIDRISRETNFNGTDVLALDRDLTIQVGANDGQTIEVKLQEINATTLNLADFSVTGDRQITAAQMMEDFGAELQSSTYNVVDGEGDVTDTYNIDGATGDVTDAAGVAMNVALDGSLTADADSTGVALAATDVLAADSGWEASTAQANDAANLGDALGAMANNETVTANGVTYTADGAGGFTSDATLDTAGSIAAVNNQTVEITSGANTFNVTFDGSGNITTVTDAAGDPLVDGLQFNGGTIEDGTAGTAITTAAELFASDTDPNVGNFEVELSDRTLAWNSAVATQASTVTFTQAGAEAEIAANDATFAAIDGQAYFREGATGTLFTGADNTGTEVNASSVDGSLTTDAESGGVDANGNGVYTLTNDAGTTFTVEITGSTDPDGSGAALASGSDTAFVHNGEVFADETIALNAATLADVEALEGVELQSAQYTIADGDFAGDYFVGADELVRTSNDFVATDNIVHLGTQDGEAVLRSGEDVSTATTDPMAALDAALNQVDSLRSELGAVQNRFEDAINNLSTNETNLAAARSRIEDADYAVEVADMTRAQILQQAGTSVLAQANQIPQIALSLLG